MSDVANALLAISDRLAAIELSLGLPNGASAGGSDEVVVPRSIKAFDAYCVAYLDPFVATCEKLGGAISTIGQAVKAAWGEQRAFLMMASACKAPKDSEIQPLLAGIMAKMKDMGALVKRDEFEKHAKTCTEGMSALNWLVIKPAPRDYIESVVGGADYWANNIRREHRTTNPDQVAFCDQFKALLMEMMVYVKEHHTTGVTWNPKGGEASGYTAGAPAASAAAAAAAPVAATPAPVAAAKPAGGMGNLFKDLSKGGSVTSGLKTVTKDQQTWRAEFKGGDAPAPIKAIVPKKPISRDVVKGTPKFEFSAPQSKWLVEYQSEKVNVTIADKKETVYILGCINATVHVSGKCKSIILDSCKKTNVTFDCVMASFEVVNSQRVNVTCLEKAAAVCIDKTDGIVVTLPNSSLDTEVTASKSSEMNLSWPCPEGHPGAEPGDMMERPIPEQYIHRIVNNAVTAGVSDLYTH